MDAPLPDNSSATPVRKSLWLRVFHNYLNSGITDGAGIEVRLVNAITLIGSLNIVASIFIELSAGKHLLAGFMFTVMLCALINVLLLRKTHNATLAASCILLVTLLMFTVMLLDGLYQNTAPVWLAIYPAMAFFFKGKRQGLAWVGALLATMLLILLAQSSGLLHTPFSPTALLVFSASTTTVGLMVYVYESMRAKAEASLQQAHVELQQMAHSDMLTALPNRTAFYKQLPLSIARAQEAGHRLAVLFIDLDDFKPVNDTYGHEVGDTLLRQAARRLRQHLRSSDFIARFGGDEFVAILPGLSEQHEVGRIADKLINALASPFTIGEHQCSIGVSIGIGLYPDCASSAESLVQLADHAMYTTKLSGKNGYAACPVVQGEDVTPYQGKYACNRSCLEGVQCDTPP